MLWPPSSTTSVEMVELVFLVFKGTCDLCCYPRQMEWVCMMTCISVLNGVGVDPTFLANPRGPPTTAVWKSLHLQLSRETICTLPLKAARWFLYRGIHLHSAILVLLKQGLLTLSSVKQWHIHCDCLLNCIEGHPAPLNTINPPTLLLLLVFGGKNTNCTQILSSWSGSVM